MSENINRLRGMRCYSAGPMDHYEHSLAIAWRTKLGNFLKGRGVTHWSPLDKPCDDEEIAETEQDKQELQKLKNAGEFDEVRRIMKKVVNLDLGLVDRADFIVAQVDPKVHLCGTYHEIIVADEHRRPTLIFVDGGKQVTPNWLLGIVPHENIFNTLDEVIDYLRFVDTCDKESAKALKRWFFFDQSRMH